MPIYSFDCPKCHRRVQKAFATDRRWMDCPACGAMMKRQGYTRESSYLDDQKSREQYNKEKADELKWRQEHGK